MARLSKRAEGGERRHERGPGLLVLGLGVEVPVRVEQRALALVAELRQVDLGAPDQVSKRLTARAAEETSSKHRCFSNDQR
jgi:hypothetical protein